MNDKKQRKIELKIDKEKIKNLYKLKLYQIDLNGERHYKNGYLTISTKCDMVYKNYDISDILKYGNFKPVMDVLCYESKVVPHNRKLCIREFITRRVLPTCTDIDKIYDAYTLEDGTIIPFFVYYDTLYNDDALSETIEKYINKYVGDSEYINDAKTNVNKLIDDLYKKAVDDYILLMNKCDYSEEYNLKTKSKFILAKMLKKGQTSPYPKLKSKFNYLIWRSD